MIFSLIYILITIIWIVYGTSKIKLHPFFVLLSACLLLGLLLGIDLNEILNLIKDGSGKIIRDIGLLILFGTLIGVALEDSNGTLSIANGLLKNLHKLPLTYAVSCIGYLVSIPVFCDAAFVILSRLIKELATQTKTPMVGLTVSLSTGLFAPHVLVPPTPGPLAAASNLELENIFLLVFVGGLIAFILILVGGAYGNYLVKNNKHEFKKYTYQNFLEPKSSTPAFSKAIQPIIIPIILMGIGAFIKFLPDNSSIFTFLKFVTEPPSALFIGMLFAFRIVFREKNNFLKNILKKGFSQSAPIIIVTAMGGALGSIIQTIPIQEYTQNITSNQALGLLIPFIIAAILKTAQGSSTVAIITTSSIILPLLPILDLDSEVGKVWAIMALGVGSMTVSHANDSYFWVVTQMTGMKLETAYKTHTIGTLLQGVVGFLIVLSGYSFWKLIT